mmetsp:Transcript_156698/g.500090  ORF Transcript_156698/g.500090 Transcript_156698/m.500090 type:complete len:158 (+) Transcript_156698:2-475(+)
MYACFYMSGRFGLISSITEQGFYAYSDALVKVILGALMAVVRNTEYVGIIRRWWAAAASASADMDSLIRMAKVPVLSLDLTGSIVSWNANLESLTGLLVSEVKGKKLFDVAHGDNQEAIVEAMKVAKESASSASLIEISIPVGGDSSSGGQRSVSWP